MSEPLARPVVTIGPVRINGVVVQAARTVEMPAPAPRPPGPLSLTGRPSRPRTGWATFGAPGLDTAGALCRNIVDAALGLVPADRWPRPTLVPPAVEAAAWDYLAYRTDRVLFGCPEGEGLDPDVARPLLAVLARALAAIITATAQDDPPPLVPPSWTPARLRALATDLTALESRLSSVGRHAAT